MLPAPPRTRRSMRRRRPSPRAKGNAVSLRASAAERQLAELRAEVEKERPNVLAQRAELAQLQSRVPELESQLAAMSLASEEDKKDLDRARADHKMAAQEAKN